MSYIPVGRTDEASYDYTDDPSRLRDLFTRGQLVEGLEDGGMLKFDYEEYVPVAAIKAALR